MNVPIVITIVMSNQNVAWTFCMDMNANALKDTALMRQESVFQSAGKAAYEDLALNLINASVTLVMLELTVVFSVSAMVIPNVQDPTSLINVCIATTIHWAINVKSVCPSMFVIHVTMVNVFLVPSTATGILICV